MFWKGRFDRLHNVDECTLSSGVSLNDQFVQSWFILPLLKCFYPWYKMVRIAVRVLQSQSKNQSCHSFFSLRLGLFVKLTVTVIWMGSEDTHLPRKSDPASESEYWSSNSHASDSTGDMVAMTILPLSAPTHEQAQNDMLQNYRQYRSRSLYGHCVCCAWDNQLSLKPAFSCVVQCIPANDHRSCASANNFNATNTYKHSASRQIASANGWNYFLLMQSCSMWSQHHGGNQECS